MSEISYSEAFSELQEIVTEIERGQISVDELSQKVKRAAALIKICKRKLTSTEEDVNEILKELDTVNVPKEPVKATEPKPVEITRLDQLDDLPF